MPETERRKGGHCLLGIVVKDPAARANAENAGAPEDTPSYLIAVESRSLLVAESLLRVDRRLPPSDPPRMGERPHRRFCLPYIVAALWWQRPRTGLLAENALLRQQLIAVRRQVKRPHLTPADRSWMVAANTNGRVVAKPILAGLHHAYRRAC